MVFVDDTRHSQVCTLLSCVMSDCLRECNWDGFGAFVLV
jgi:hypothetical protein